MVRLQFKNFEEYGVSNTWLSLLPGPLCLGFLVPVRVSSTSQIEFFNHLQKIIILSYLKPHNCEQIIYIL